MPSGPLVNPKKLATSASLRAEPARPNKAMAANSETIPATIFSTIAKTKKKWNSDISAKGFATRVIIAPHITVSIPSYTTMKAAPANRRMAYTAQRTPRVPYAPPDSFTVCMVPRLFAWSKILPTLRVLILSRGYDPRTVALLGVTRLGKSYAKNCPMFRNFW